MTESASARPRRRQPWAAEGAAVTTLIFNTTGPIMMLISVALKAGMEPGLLAAALRAIFLTGGAITIWLSYRYRQPYVMAFSLTGGLMWLSHYDRYPVGVVVAANLAVAALMACLGFTRAGERIQRWLPAPITIAVFTGVLFPVILTGIRGVAETPAVGLAVAGVGLVVWRTGTFKRWVPPAVAAAAVAGVHLWLTGVACGTPTATAVDLVLFRPVWEWRAVLELAAPMALAAILIHNAQSLTLMSLNGFQPDANRIMRWSGLGGLLSAPFLGFTPAMAAPLTGLVSAPSAGPKERRWMASLLFGVGWVVTAFLAPGLIRWLACFPAGLLALIGAIAMLDPISLLVRTAFTGEYALGSFIAFAVTVSGIGVSAPLWGVAAGLLIVRLAARRTKPTGDIERES